MQFWLDVIVMASVTFTGGTIGALYLVARK